MTVLSLSRWEQVADLLEGFKQRHSRKRNINERVSAPVCYPCVPTLVVFAVQVCSMASVHPPAGAVLLGTVAVVLVVVLVEGAELHAVVGRVELVTGIVSEVKAGEGVSRVAAKVEAVGQAIHVGL